VNSDLLSIVSLIITLIAVMVAVWHVRAVAVAAERANSLPVASDVFKEFRSQEFQDHLRKVWDNAPRNANAPEDGFQSLPDDWRDSAYTVAYFFEYLGVLVAYKIVPDEIVIDFSANLLVRTWRALEPLIQKERTYREKSYTSDISISKGFVRHFEHLVALSIDANGEPVDASIHERLGLRKMVY
jgi:hypothetical protein